MKIFIPDYQYLFYDLSPYGGKEIKGGFRLRIFLELLAAVLHQDYQNFNLTVKKILADFRQLEGENSEQALRYLETIRKNLQPLCKSCHSKKTAEKDGGFVSE